MRRFFKIATNMLAIVAFVILPASCGENENPVIEVSFITLTPSELSIKVGSRQMLTASVEPENAEDKTIVWSSSDPAIAYVNASTGEVTGNALGVAGIIATAASGKTATCAVTVVENVIEVSSISVSPDILELQKGEKRWLTVTVEPQHAANKTVVWSSSDPKTVEVDTSTGELTAKASGTATVTATAADKTATCTVSVWEAVGELVQEGEILIIAYGGAPYGEVKAAKLDMCWTWASLADVTEGLNQARDNGIKLLVVLQKDNTEAMVNAIKGHPALGGYILADEHPMQDFWWLEEWVKEIQALDTEHYCYINLLPNHASAQQLGTSSYLEYLETFAKLSTGFMSFDNYPTNGLGGVNAMWYANLEDVRNVANEHGIPFWAYVLSTRNPGGPAFTLGELSLMVYSNLAYGSQAIQYFVFYGGDPSTHTPIAGGRRTPTYDYVKKINTDVKRLSHIFSKSKVLGVWHTGKILPAGTVKLQEENPPEMPPVKSLKTVEGGALVSLIEKDDNHYMIIVNRDYLSPIQLTLTVDENVVRKVRKEGYITNAYSGTVEVDAGDVVIYMWKK